MQWLRHESREVVFPLRYALRVREHLRIKHIIQLSISRKSTPKYVANI